ncbi:hypothetical protein JCM21900_001948 [Sporobolomyces salmonicolor]
MSTTLPPLDAPPPLSFSSKEEIDESPTYKFDEKTTPTSVDATGANKPVAQIPWRYKGLPLCLVLLFGIGVDWSSSAIAPIKETLKKELHINNSQYGVISTSTSLVNTVVPCVSGVLIDYYGPQWSSLLTFNFAGFVLVGTIVSAAGASANSFGLLTAGQVLIGCGNMAIETAQLAILSTWFYGSYLGLALGLNIAVARIIAVVAKATSVPIADEAGYAWDLWVPAIIQGVCLVLNIIYVVYERQIPKEYQRLTGRQRARLLGRGGFVVELKKFWEVIWRLPAFYWCFILTQLLESPVIETYISLQPDIVNVTRSSGELAAGWISAVGEIPVIFLTPLTGFFFDRCGYRVHFIALSAVGYIIIFCLLGFTGLNAIAVTLLQSLPYAINLLPIQVVISLVVPSLGQLGTAQGTYQSLVNSGHVIISTAAGAIQDLTPTGRHSYNNVLYFFIAVKILDIFVGLFYIVLDRVALNRLLSRSNKQQRKHVARIERGEITEKPARMMAPDRAWTITGLVFLVVSTVIAWTVYLVYVQ